MLIASTSTNVAAGLVPAREPTGVPGNEERVEERAPRRDRRLRSSIGCAAVGAGRRAHAVGALRRRARGAVRGDSGGASTRRCRSDSAHRRGAAARRPNGAVAGVHGNRTHPTRRGRVASVLKTEESHQAPSTPHASRKHEAACSARDDLADLDAPRERAKDTRATRAGGHGDEQSARRLRIDRAARDRRRSPCPSRRSDSRYARCARRRRCAMPRVHSVARARQAPERDAPSMRSVTSLARAMCDAWPSRPNPVTSVAQRAPTASAARLAVALSLHIDVVQRLALASASELAAASRAVARSAGAERLREHEPIARPARSRCVSSASRMRAAGDRQAELELLVDDRVAADDERARLVHLVLPAAQDLGEHVDAAACPTGKPTMFSAVSGSPPIA